jgi:hypothetical protein
MVAAIKTRSGRCPIWIANRIKPGFSATSEKCRFCSLMSQGATTLIVGGGALPLGACVLCVLDGTSWGQLGAGWLG